MAAPSTDSKGSPSILVISTGGIGSFVQTLGAFTAIRMHHGGANIVIAVNSRVIGFASTSPYFNDVVSVGDGLNALTQVIKSRNWDRVYDLDCSPSTSRVFRKAQTWRQRFGLDKPLEWCGVAKGCSLPHTNPHRLLMHESDRAMDQLAEAGIDQQPPVSVAWVSRAVGTFSIPVSLSEPFMLFAIDPGGAYQAQWPVSRCIEMAELIAAGGHRVVLVGEYNQDEIGSAVTESVPDTINLCGTASHIEIVFLAWAAAGAVGYDNGLMHLTTTAGCKSVILYDPGSDAALTGHRGPDVTILRRHNLDAISAVEVMHCFDDVAAA